MYIPADWTTSEFNWLDFRPEDQIGGANGITYWMHPTSESVYAMTLDHIGMDGPTVFETDLTLLDVVEI